jgi:hypothetical protein
VLNLGLFRGRRQVAGSNNPFLQKQVEQRNDYGFSIGGRIKRQAVRFLQPE